MSAETAVANLVSTLQALSTWYRGSAYALAQQADAALEGMTPPPVAAIEFDVVRPTPDYTRVPLPPTLAGMDPLTLPTMGDLQAVDQVVDRFTADVPTLNLPEFSETRPGAAPEFTGVAPDLDSPELLPVAPTITATEPPILTRPTAVLVDPLSGDPPTGTAPVFAPFTGDFYTEYQTGIGLAAGDLAAWSAWLKSLGGDWMLPLMTLLTTRLRAVMAGDETGVPEDWETQSYDQAQQAINAERWAAQRLLDEQPSAQTELPTGQRIWARLELELKTAQATMTAASKLSQERQTLEVKHLQWAMALAAKLLSAALELRSQEAAWRMKGVLLAMDGATGVLDLALKLLALKEKELAILTRYNDSQIRRTEDRLKIELTKLDSLRLTLESNRQIATYNEQNIQIYTLATGWSETRVKLFGLQLDALKTDIAWRKLALAAFESEISAYNATLKANAADHEALQARIKGDLAQTEAEMGKVQLYQAELAAFSAEVKQLTAQANAQSSANAAVLGEYVATLTAQMGYLRQAEQYARVALAAISKGFAAEVAQQELTMSSQQLEDRQALHEAVLELQIDQTTLLNTLKEYQVRLGQAEAEGRIISQGAGTLGGIASQAYAGLNALGSRSITEYA